MAGRFNGTYRFGAPLRRMGFPLLGGFGTGGGLFGSFLAGELGYLLGRNGANQGQVPAYQPEAAAGASDAALEKLKILSELHDRGILTDAEFEEEKSRLLNR